MVSINTGTYLGFRELAMSDRAYAAKATPCVNYHELDEAVAKVQAGIGYVSLNVMRELGLYGVLINGIQPSSIAVIEGSYSYARKVRLM